MPARLSDLLLPARLTEVVDVGANPIDSEPPYTAMLHAGLCRVTGFEPQAVALRELQQAKGPNETYLPYAVGDGRVHTLHHCVGPGMTSLLEPDFVKLELFDFLKSLAKVTEREQVQTHALDEISEIECLDFLKIDIQGGELAVFQGGAARISEAVAIQTEISFVTLYKDQPTFGDVDVDLRARGFLPHSLADVKKFPISPCVIAGEPYRPLNQLLEADIVYVRDFSRPELMSDEQLKHLALIAHHCYGSFDLALRCVLLLERRAVLPTGTQRRYLELVAGN